MTDRIAHYFGCYDKSGHCFWRTPNSLRGKIDESGLPWSMNDMDGGLLKNGEHSDVVNGQVYWTVAKDLPTAPLPNGGTAYNRRLARPTTFEGHFPIWFAFYWWDRSGDRRPNSNSGFYVRGFEFTERGVLFQTAMEAFKFACDQWPSVIVRQKHPLRLVEK